MPDNLQLKQTAGLNRPVGSKLSAAVLSLIMAGASAPVIMGQFLDEKEGARLRSYQDGVKIWTACRGVTHFNGQAIRPNMVFTKQECADLDKTELFKALNELDEIVKVPLSEPARAGIASFCTYNLGGPKCRASTFIRLLNQGRPMRVRACAQIPLWIHDGGKDCRVRANQCFGQVERRDQEQELCNITTGEPA